MVIRTAGAACGHTQPTHILTLSKGRSAQFAYMVSSRNISGSQNQSVLCYFNMVTNRGWDPARKSCLFLCHLLHVHISTSKMSDHKRSSYQSFYMMLCALFSRSCWNLNHELLHLLGRNLCSLIVYYRLSWLLVLPTIVFILWRPSI